MKICRYLPFLVSASLMGAVISWDGDQFPNDLWSEGNNWGGGFSPGLGDTADFPAPTGGTGNVDLDSNVTIDNVIFNTNTVNYTINPNPPGSTLTLTTNAINFAVDGLHTITAPLSAAGNLVITGDSATGDLRLSGDNSAVLEGITLNRMNLRVSADNQLGFAGTPLSFVTFSGSLIAESGFTSSRPMVLDAASPSIEVEVGTLTWLGNISENNGPRSLNKTGKGTLVLSGNNTFGGTLTISDGILSVGKDANLGSGSLINRSHLQATDSFSTAKDIQLNNPIIEVAEGKVLTLEGTVTNDTEAGSSLTKTGLGTLELKGLNYYSGPTYVQAGTLAVNSPLGASIPGPGPTEVEVSFGATLQGSSIVGNVKNNGTVNAGNSIGTLTIIGNYTQNANSTLAVEINAAGGTDVLNVQGSALINAGSSVTVLPEPGLYLAGTTYDFLITTGGITGTFDSIIESHEADFQINYLPLIGGITFAQLEILGVTAIEPTPSIDLHGNARAVANYLFCPAEINTSNEDWIKVLSTLLTQTPSNYSKALINLSPAQYGALPLQNLNKDLTFSSALVRRIEERMYCDRCNSPSGNRPNSCNNETRRTSVWSEILGEWQRQDGIQEQYAFHDQTYGFAIGASHLFANHLLLSGATGYTYSDLHWKNNKGSANTNALYIGPSLGYSLKNTFVNFLTQVAFNWNSVDRKIQFPGLSRTAHSHFTSYDLLLRLDGGYRFAIHDNTNKGGPLLIIPEGRLSYLNVWHGSFSENGASSLNLNVKSRRASFLQPEILVKILKEFYVNNSCIIPSIKTGYVAKIPLSSSNYKATLDVIDCSSDLSVKTFDKTTNQLMLGAGLLYKTLEHISAGFDYEAHMFDKNLIQNAKLSFDWRF